MVFKTTRVSSHRKNGNWNTLWLFFNPEGPLLQASNFKILRARQDYFGGSVEVGDSPNCSVVALLGRTKLIYGSEWVATWERNISTNLCVLRENSTISHIARDFIRKFYPNFIASGQVQFNKSVSFFFGQRSARLWITRLHSRHVLFH